MGECLEQQPTKTWPVWHLFELNVTRLAKNFSAKIVILHFLSKTFCVFNFVGSFCCFFLLYFFQYLFFISRHPLSLKFISIIYWLWNHLITYFIVSYHVQRDKKYICIFNKLINIRVDSGGLYKHYCIKSAVVCVWYYIMNWLCDNFCW